MLRIAYCSLTAVLFVVAGCGSPPSINPEKEVSSNEEEYSSNSDGGRIPINTEPAPDVEDYGQAPDMFRAKFETSKGDFIIEVTRAWSPSPRRASVSGISFITSLCRAPHAMPPRRILTTTIRMCRMRRTPP